MQQKVWKSQEFLGMGCLKIFLVKGKKTTGGGGGGQSNPPPPRGEGVNHARDQKKSSQKLIYFFTSPIQTKENECIVEKYGARSANQYYQCGTNKCIAII